jgi:hypothetical protein
MDQAVFMPVVNPHAIRDGPMQYRQWPGELRKDANREAA